MAVIQKELDEVAREWNFHGIKKSKHEESLGGVPELLYYAPEMEGKYRLCHLMLRNTGGHSYRFPLNDEDFQQ